MEFPAASKRQTSACFSFHGVHSSRVRGRGETGFQEDASGSHMAPARPREGGGAGAAEVGMKKGSWLGLAFRCSTVNTQSCHPARDNLLPLS